jgi:hypothetical protein
MASDADPAADRYQIERQIDEASEKNVAHSTQIRLRSSRSKKCGPRRVSRVA